LQTLVKQYVEYINEVARGNLAAQVHVAGNGSIRTIPSWFWRRTSTVMTNSLRTMIVQIKDAVNNLSSATAEILAGDRAAGRRRQRTIRRHLRNDNDGGRTAHHR
jgi:methyl-accepting chemotaxis protein